MNRNKDPKKSFVDSHATALYFSDITQLFRAEIS
jgi:hypothetical protein